MTGERNEGSQQRSYLRIGLALLGAVIVLLAAAFLLNRQMQPHVGIEPASTVVARATPHPAPTGHSGNAAAPTARPGTAGATRTAPGPTPWPTPTPTPRQAVIQAYHRYWQRYSEALYTLDASYMRDVATGQELRDAEAEVADLRRRNDAVRVRVTHHALIVSLNRDTATIYDEILNRSFIIDPITKRPPTGSTQSDLEKDIYYLKKIHGVWKVTKTLRQKG